MLAWVYRANPPGRHEATIYCIYWVFLHEAEPEHLHVNARWVIACYGINFPAFSFTEYLVPSNPCMYQCIIIKECKRNGKNKNLPLANPPSWASRSPLTWRWTNIGKQQRANHRWQLECFRWVFNCICTCTFNNTNTTQIKTLTIKSKPSLTAWMLSMGFQLHLYMYV